MNPRPDKCGANCSPPIRSSYLFAISALGTTELANSFDHNRGRARVQLRLILKILFSDGRSSQSSKPYFFLLKSLLSSATGFGEILLLWQKFKRCLQIFQGLFSVCQNSQPTLARVFFCLANFHCCKWPNVRKYDCHLVTLLLSLSPSASIESLRPYRQKYSQIIHESAADCFCFSQQQQKCWNDFCLSL